MKPYTFFKISEKGIDPFEIEHVANEADARSHARLVLLTGSYNAIEVMGGVDTFRVEREELKPQSSL